MLIDAFIAELAALTGMGERDTQSLFPGRDTPTMSSRRSQNGQVRPYDPAEDDPVDHNVSIKSGHANHDHSHGYIVAPSIQVRPEFQSLVRTQEPNQQLTCIVVVELPSRRANAHVPGPVIKDVYRSPSMQSLQTQNSRTIGRHNGIISSNLSAEQSDSTMRSRQRAHSATRSGSPDRQSSPSVYNNNSPRFDHSDTSESPGALAPPQMLASNADSPFRSITEDLRARIMDWKGHPLSGLGPLQMFDLLSVRRDALVREFFVYLFKEAIICVEEEKKRSLGRLLTGAQGDSSNGSAPGKGVLKLKGRIYIRHIKHVTDTSSAGELSLTLS